MNLYLEYAVLAVVALAFWLVAYYFLNANKHKEIETNELIKNEHKEELIEEPIDYAAIYYAAKEREAGKNSKFGANTENTLAEKDYAKEFSNAEMTQTIPVVEQKDEQVLETEAEVKTPGNNDKEEGKVTVADMSEEAMRITKLQSGLQENTAVANKVAEDDVNMAKTQVINVSDVIKACKQSNSDETIVIPTAAINAETAIAEEVAKAEAQLEGIPDTKEAKAQAFMAKRSNGDFKANEKAEDIKSEDSVKITEKPKIYGYDRYEYHYGTPTAEELAAIENITTNALSELGLDENDDIDRVINTSGLRRAMLDMQRAYVVTTAQWMKVVALLAFVSMVKQPRQKTLYVILKDILHLLPSMSENDVIALVSIYLIKNNWNKEAYDKMSFASYVENAFKKILDEIPLEDRIYRNLERMRCLELVESEQSFAQIISGVDEIESYGSPRVEALANIFEMTPMTNADLTCIGIYIAKCYIEVELQNK